MFEFWDWSLLRQQQNRILACRQHTFHLEIKPTRRARQLQYAELQYNICPIVCDTVVSSLRTEIGKKAKNKKTAITKSSTQLKLEQYIRILRSIMTDI